MCGKTADAEHKQDELQLDLTHLFGPTPRVVVVRGGRLGDFLAITPALRALRRTYPSARIDVIVSRCPG